VIRGVICTNLVMIQGNHTLNAFRNILQPAHNASSSSSSLENSRPTHSRSTSNNTDSMM
jgi:hypothetical protein